jgi:hypothetical protein
MTITWKPSLGHAFTNLLTSLDRDKRAAVARQRGKREAAKAREAIARLTSRIRNVVLMDLVLPNGKKLRNATFSECSAAGGWFKLVATKGKLSQIVGEVLSEQDLKEIA